MAQPVTQQTTGPAIEDAFLADRQKFWGRFTSFTTRAAGVVVVVLLGLLIFVY